MILTEDTVTRIPSVPVSAVDTTGCGDAYMGAILAGLASGLNLRDSAELASYVGAYAATGEGAQPSYGTPSMIQRLFDATS